MRSISLLVASVPLVFLAFDGVEAQQSPISNVAIVRALSLDRELDLRRAGSDAVELAQLMESLNGGDFVQTRANTRAAIQFTDDMSVIRMNPETLLEIRTEGERGAMTKIVDIRSGEFWAQVNRRDGSEYRIQTPTAVAAVRGTEFIVRVEDDGRTTIITLEGLLEFFTDLGTVEIPAGTRGTATASTEPPSIEPATQEELVQYQALIQGEGLGTAGSSSQAQQWQTVEVNFVGPDGRTVTWSIPVPAGSVPGGEQ